MDFSNRLRDIRKLNGLSQQQLADLIGVSRQTLSKWETGVALPDVDNLISLAEALHVTTDYLLVREEKIDSDNPRSTCRRLRKKYDHTYELIGYFVAVIVLVIALVGCAITNSNKADVYIKPGESYEPAGTCDISRELMD